MRVNDIIANQAVRELQQNKQQQTQNTSGVSFAESIREYVSRANTVVRGSEAGAAGLSSKKISAKQQKKQKTHEEEILDLIQDKISAINEMLREKFSGSEEDNG